MGQKGVRGDKAKPLASIPVKAEFGVPRLSSGRFRGIMHQAPLVVQGKTQVQTLELLETWVLRAWGEGRHQCVPIADE